LRQKEQNVGFDDGLKISTYGQSRQFWLII